MLSGDRRGGGVLSGERKGGVAAVTHESGKAAAALGRERECDSTSPVTRARIENIETIAKQKQLPTAGLDIMCAAHPQNIT